MFWRAPEFVPVAVSAHSAADVTRLFGPGLPSPGKWLGGCSRDTGSSIYCRSENAFVTSTGKGRSPGWQGDAEDDGKSRGNFLIKSRCFSKILPSVGMRLLA